jgi:hypothetical protein
MLKTGAIVFKVAVECLARASSITVSEQRTRSVKNTRHASIDADMSHLIWIHLHA